MVLEEARVSLKGNGPRHDLPCPEVYVTQGGISQVPDLDLDIEHCVVGVVSYEQSPKRATSPIGALWRETY